MVWPLRLLRVLDMEVPILGAPMNGASGWAMCVAVSEGGGLGSLPCAGWDMSRCHEEIEQVKARTTKKFNLNFFCHDDDDDDAKDTTTSKKKNDYSASERWRRFQRQLAAFGGPVREPESGRAAFGEAACRLVEEHKPGVTSFHFGLPSKDLLQRVKATGAIVMASATTVKEATWLEANGADVVIAQGLEAGGHRSNFLSFDPNDVSNQVGTFALVPLVVDAVSVPVVAAGGVSDGRGAAAALILGADAVQIGSAFLNSAESLVPDYHRAKLSCHETVLTNVFTGRPARGFRNDLVDEVGPLNPDAPPFPLAAGCLKDIIAKDPPATAALWAGQAASLAAYRSDNKVLSAKDLTTHIAHEAKRLLLRSNT